MQKWKLNYGTLACFAFLIAVIALFCKGLNAVSFQCDEEYVCHVLIHDLTETFPSKQPHILKRT